MRPFDASLIFQFLPKIIPYLRVTLLMVFGTLIAGGLLGFALAAMKLGKNRILHSIATIYTGAMRCTPSIVLLFMVYYGLPELWQSVFHVNINFIYRGYFVLITFSLLFGASMSEIMRSAYLAVSKGQREAALSIGLTEWQTFRRILLPQAALFALPNFGNMTISLMKEGSLAYTIGLIDVMGQGNLIISRNFGAHALETYIALALIYWALTLLFQYAFALLERRFGRGRRAVVR